MERKEAELTQLKAASVSRVGLDMIKSRPISPLVVHGGINGVVFKPEINHRINEDPPKTEVKYTEHCATLYISYHTVDNNNAVMVVI